MISESKKLLALLITAAEEAPEEVYSTFSRALEKVRELDPWMLMLAPQHILGVIEQEIKPALAEDPFTRDFCKTNKAAQKLARLVQADIPASSKMLKRMRVQPVQELYATLFGKALAERGLQPQPKGITEVTAKFPVTVGEFRYVPSIDRYIVVIQSAEDGGIYRCAPVSRFRYPGTESELLLGEGIVLQQFASCTLFEETLLRYTEVAERAVLSKRQLRDAVQMYQGFGATPSHLEAFVGAPTNVNTLEYVHSEMEAFWPLNGIDMEGA